MRETLSRVGYGPELLEEGHLDDAGEPISWIAAYAQSPRTARNACVAAIQARHPGAVEHVVRATGVALALLVDGERVSVWQGGRDGCRELDNLSIDDFGLEPPEQLRGLLDPRAIHRAKTLGRYDGSYQLEFVDIGLLPQIERAQGDALQRLLERIVTALRPDKGALTAEQGHQVLTIAFWILAARMLRDHRVPGFVRLAADGRKILEAVARHYSGSMPLLATERGWSKRVDLAARIAWDHGGQLDKFGPEAIGHVYESSLIADSTRRDLGTHSTPPFLIEYVLGRLRRHILEIPADRRVVVEPACGHGAFLVAALRVLAEDLQGAGRHAYLRSRLRGVEIDHAAMEMARLSLTIADVPNPNGWDLREGDMFRDRALERLAQGGTVLLSNPPFEDFSPEERQRLADETGEAVASNKAAEMLRRILPALEPDAVVGLIVPRQFLTASADSGVRRLLLARYQLLEICLLPDKVFREADHECAVILARGAEAGTRRDLPVLVRRVRESGIADFKHLAEVSTEDHVPGAVFHDSETASLFVPELRRLWTARAWATLGDVATVQQGMSYHGWVREGGHETVRDHAFKNSAPGISPPGKSSDTPITAALPYNYMDIDRAHIRRTMGGLPTGAPQVVLNTHPHGRGPWRIMAYIDPRGAAVPSTRIAVRPTANMSVEILWALCNSPLANAYVYAHLGKRDITTGDLRRLPVPALSPGHAAELTRMVHKFFKAAQESAAGERLAAHLAAIDAALLSAYGLFAPAEQQLLALFAGHPRPGLPIEVDAVGVRSRLPQYIALPDARSMLPAEVGLGPLPAVADLDAEIDDGRTELAALRRASGDERVEVRMAYVRRLLQRLETTAAAQWRPAARMSNG